MCNADHNYNIMIALLEINEGEEPYRAAVSQWLRDEDGALVFKVISKKRRDGQIEFICYTQRSDAQKRIIQHISFAEENFWKIMDTLEQSLRHFFPDIKFAMQNVTLTQQEGYRVLKNNKFNLFRLAIINWFAYKFNALKTRFTKKNK